MTWVTITKAAPHWSSLKKHTCFSRGTRVGTSSTDTQFHLRVALLWASQWRNVKYLLQRVTLLLPTTEGNQRTCELTSWWNIRKKWRRVWEACFRPSVLSLSMIRSLHRLFLSGPNPATPWISCHTNCNRSTMLMNSQKWWVSAEGNV